MNLKYSDIERLKKQESVSLQEFTTVFMDRLSKMLTHSPEYASGDDVTELYKKLNTADRASYNVVYAMYSFLTDLYAYVVTCSELAMEQVHTATLLASTSINQPVYITETQYKRYRAKQEEERQTREEQANNRKENLYGFLRNEMEFLPGTAVLGISEIPTLLKDVVNRSCQTPKTHRISDAENIVVPRADVYSRYQGRPLSCRNENMNVVEFLDRVEDILKQETDTAESQAIERTLREWLKVPLKQAQEQYPTLSHDIKTAKMIEPMWTYRELAEAGAHYYKIYTSMCQKELINFFPKNKQEQVKKYGYVVVLKQETKDGTSKKFLEAIKNANESLQIYLKIHQAYELIVESFMSYLQVDTLTSILNPKWHRDVVEALEEFRSVAKVRESQNLSQDLTELISVDVNKKVIMLNKEQTIAKLKKIYTTYITESVSNFIWDVVKGDSE